jgi:hypothetical protein
MAQSKKRKKSDEAEPTQLPSGRWRVYLWDAVAKRKVFVTNRARTRGTQLRAMFPGGGMDFVFRVPKKSGSVRLLPQYIHKLWREARKKAGLNERTSD